MLTVEITSMPASSSSSTSCQRFSCRDPGTFVWASSSTRATFGCGGEDRVDVHLLERRAAVGRLLRRGTTSRSSDLLGRLRPAVGLDEADDDVRAPLRAAAPSFSMRVRLADPGAAPR